MGVSRPRILLVLLLFLVSACAAEGTYTQEELDARIEEAVAAAIAEQSGSSEGTATSSSTAASSTTTTRPPTTTTTLPPTTTSTVPPLSADDFFADIDVLESSCFGSAGANVRFEVLWGWDGEAFGTLTYEIRGLDDGAVDIATTEIVGTQFGVQEHFVGIPTCDPLSTIEVVPVRFRAEQ